MATILLNYMEYSTCGTHIYSYVWLPYVQKFWYTIFMNVAMSYYIYVQTFL